MSLSKITKRFNNYSTKDDVVPILAREHNLVVDQVNTNETNVALKANSASPTFTGTVTLPDVTMSGHTNAQVFLANAFHCPDPGTEWTPDIYGVSLPASQTAVKCWVPLNFLKVGDEIVSYSIIGDIAEVAAATLDCKLVKVNLADPLTTTDVAGGAITQIAVDGDFTGTKAPTAIETVVADKMYLLEVLGTTGAGDAISVMGVAVTVNRK
jgi:hypothetical protein